MNSIWINIVISLWTLVGFVMILVSIPQLRNWRNETKSKTLPGIVFKCGLLVIIVFVFSPIMLPIRTYRYLKSLRRELKGKTWFKKSPQFTNLELEVPIKKPAVSLCYNTMHGVTVVVREKVYNEAKDRHLRNIRDGISPKNSPIPPSLIGHCYLYLHKSADARVPKEYITGRLSDFDDFVNSKFGDTVVARKKDIFVPFTPGSTVDETVTKSIRSWTIDNLSERANRALGWLGFQYS